MGFDASVISGVVGYIETDFSLTKLEVGWAVSSLTLTSTFAMLSSGPLSDKVGRRQVLRYAALLFIISAILSAIAPNFWFLVVARMIGGFGVGAALIIAPIYIAEISPPESRGRMVSFNQFNIVIGISTAFFSNYMIQRFSQIDASWVITLAIDADPWRWMLGMETIPAVFYLVVLFMVSESPRWLLMKGRESEARIIMIKATGEQLAEVEILAARESFAHAQEEHKSSVSDLFKPAMKLVLTIGLTVGIVQQITGINSVFFYAPSIFEQSGVGTNAAFTQAIWIGITNVVCTVIAISLIDKLGRKPLLVTGVAGVVISMLLISYSFNQATYTLTTKAIAELPAEIDGSKLQSIADKRFDNDVAFKNAIKEALGNQQAAKYESKLIQSSASMNSMLILIGILGFVGSFSISLGPVMWVLFSELFPNAIRGIAVSFVGLVNSAVSFLVQLAFPWELANLGNSMTFLIYGLFGIAGLVIIIWILPETKGKSLEELEKLLVKK